MYFPWRAAFQVKDMQVNAKPFPQLVSFGCSRYRERERERDVALLQRTRGKEKRNLAMCPNLSHHFSSARFIKWNCV